jgi:hypothetical protein
MPPSLHSHNGTANSTLHTRVAFTGSKAKLDAILLLRYDSNILHIVVAPPVAPRTIAARGSDLREWWNGVGAGERAFGKHWAGDEVVGWGTAVD